MKIRFNNLTKYARSIVKSGEEVLFGYNPTMSNLAVISGRNYKKSFAKGVGFSPDTYKISKSAIAVDYSLPEVKRSFYYNEGVRTPYKMYSGEIVPIRKRRPGVGFMSSTKPYNPVYTKYI